MLPLFEKLKCHSSTVGVRAAVLSPTRELALQTSKWAAFAARVPEPRRSLGRVGRALGPQPMVALRFCTELSHFISPPLRFCLMVGGDSMDDQFTALANNPDCIVATPGR